MPRAIEKPSAHGKCAYTFIKWWRAQFKRKNNSDHTNKTNKGAPTQVNWLVQAAVVTSEHGLWTNALPGRCWRRANLPDMCRCARGAITSGRLWACVLPSLHHWMAVATTNLSSWSQQHHDDQFATSASHLEKPIGQVSLCTDLPIGLWQLGPSAEPHLLKFYLLHFICRLNITCDNSVYGCTQVLKLDALGNHLEECEHNPKKPLPCERGCGSIIPKDEFKDHNCIRELRAVIHSQQQKLVDMKNELSDQNLVMNELKREFQLFKELMRAMRVTNPAVRAIADKMERDEVVRWSNSLARARVTRWGGMISTPDDALQVRAIRLDTISAMCVAVCLICVCVSFWYYFRWWSNAPYPSPAVHRTYWTYWWKSVMNDVGRPASIRLKHARTTDAPTTITCAGEYPVNRRS